MTDLPNLLAKIEALPPPRQKQIENYVEYLTSGLSCEERGDPRKLTAAQRAERAAAGGPS